MAVSSAILLSRLSGENIMFSEMADKHVRSAMCQIHRGMVGLQIMLTSLGCQSGTRWINYFGVAKRIISITNVTPESFLNLCLRTIHSKVSRHYNARNVLNWSEVSLNRAERTVSISDESWTTDEVKRRLHFTSPQARRTQCLHLMKVESICHFYSIFSHLRHLLEWRKIY